MAFPLAAIGAGLGQFAQDYSRQQEQHRQTLMLQMQLANFQRELDKDKRASEVGDVAFGMMQGGGPQQAPIQGLPQIGGGSQGWPSGGGASALTGPIATGGSGVTPGAGAFGEYGGNQTGLGTLRSLAQQASSILPQGYRLVETSGSRPGARVTGTGGVSQHGLDNALDLQIVGPNGPIPNTGDDTTGLYGQLALAMRQLAPPDIQAKLGWGGNFTTGPANGPRDLMHYDLGGDRGRFGTLTQMAQAQPQQRGGPAATPDQALPTPGMPTSLVAGLSGGVPSGGPGGQRTFQPGAPAAATPQMAQAGPTPELPAPPPTAQDLYQRALAREQAQNPGVPVPISRRHLLAEGAQIAATGLQGQYKIELDRQKNAQDLWVKKQELVGSAETRAETARQNAASNRLRYDEITNQIRKVDEDERAGTATRADLEDKSFLAHMRQKIEANTATSQDEDRKLQRVLEEGRLKVSQQQANTATTRAANAVAKTKQKTDLAALELKSLIDKAEELAAQAATNPNLVGGRGVAGRTVGGITEQVTGGRLPGMLGGKEADKFESDMRILREQLQKPLQSQRYASKHATEQLAKLVPALELLTSSSQVAGALRNIAQALRERLHNMETAAGAVAEDVEKLTDDEIRNALPFAAPASQQ